MKKVFWTSIVWIILVCGFVLYMKWFNQPLAQKVTWFVYSGEECPVLQCDTPTCAPCNCENECNAMEGSTSWVVQEVVEPVTCNCPAQVLTWETLEICTKVFDQLDKIEKKISGTTTEKTEEELFEEFKTWYESKE